MKKFLLLSGIFLVVLMALYSEENAPVEDNRTIEVQEGNRILVQNEAVELRGPGGESVLVSAEIADTSEKHERGLMHRLRLPEGSGMLFVFREEKPLSFWMKNTLIPLDILYFSADKQFLNHHSMTPCEADPCATYGAAAPAKYALEVNAGFVARYGVREGWVLETEK